MCMCFYLPLNSKLGIMILVTESIVSIDFTISSWKRKWKYSQFNVICKRCLRITWFFCADIHLFQGDVATNINF